MGPVYVITELRHLSPTDRWQKFVVPLENELESSGLGQILDLSTLQKEGSENGQIDAEEIAIELKHVQYGQELLSRIINDSGLTRGDTAIPLRWTEFHCDDYFASPFAASGYFDEFSQSQYLRPTYEIFEDVKIEFLNVGGPGVDGIGWGYRKGMHGIWAYPYDGEFRYLTNTAHLLLDGWLSGSISM